MSTEQTDAHNAYQHRIFMNFDENFIQAWFAGNKSYDEVEEELQELDEDPDVDEYTLKKCSDLWDQAKIEEKFWAEEEQQMWRQLEADNG